MPWVNGAADVVAKPAPLWTTPAANTLIYRGRRTLCKRMGQCSGRSRNQRGQPGNYKYYMNYLPDPTKYAGGTVSSDYVKLS
ncbi:MAG: hypothetical protein ACLSG5_07800 [Oscillospiraceae bacterium]